MRRFALFSALLMLAGCHGRAGGTGRDNSRSALQAAPSLTPGPTAGAPLPRTATTIARTQSSVPVYGWLGTMAALQDTIAARCVKDEGSYRQVVDSAAAAATGRPPGAYVSYKCDDRHGSLAVWEVFVADGTDATGAMGRPEAARVPLATISVRGTMFDLLQSGAGFIEPILPAGGRSEFERKAREYVARCRRQADGQPIPDQWTIGGVEITLGLSLAGAKSGQWFMLAQRAERGEP